MLVTELKAKEELLEAVKGRKIFVIECSGCAEVYLPREEINKFLEEIKNSGITIIKNVLLDYLCNREFSELRMRNSQEEIKKAEKIIVFSCGIGVQVFSSILGKFPGKSNAVYPGCDTLYLNGFQGVTPLKIDCGQCGECYLNYTGTICPITACAKSLLNGPCGGAKNGKCEVSGPGGVMLDCGWEKIYKKLESIGRLDKIKEKIQLRSYKKAS